MGQARSRPHDDNLLSLETRPAHGYKNPWSNPYEQPKLWETLSNTTLFDVTIITQQGEPCTENYTSIAEFSLRIRTAPRHGTPLRFQLHPTKHPFATLSNDGKELAVGNATWFTLRLNCELQWNHRYYFELLLENIDEELYLMVGLCTESVHENIMHSCIYEPRFYAHPYVQIVPGTRLGFEFDLYADAMVFVFINDIPIGSFEQARSSLRGKFFPVISLCQSHKLKILDVDFPKFKSRLRAPLEQRRQVHY